MVNQAMERKIKKGQAVDVSKCERNEAGDYIIKEFVDGVDYGDSVTGQWIWSIGRNRTTGEILASTTGKFYENDAYECVWLR